MEHYQVTPLNEMNAKCNRTNRGQKEMASGCHKVGIWGVTPDREHNVLTAAGGRRSSARCCEGKRGIEATPWVYTWRRPLFGMNCKCAISNGQKLNVPVALEMKVRRGAAVRHPQSERVRAPTSTPHSPQISPDVTVLHPSEAGLKDS